MATTDPVGDMITRIRNASRQGHEYVHMPSSKLKAAIANVLKEEGFIRDFRVQAGGTGASPFPTLDLHLKYDESKQPVINAIQRLSKPGLRRYTGHDDIPRVQSGFGVVILSTPQGVLSDREARRRKVGGELLCEVW
jgi:small subunit ribosomal protein S8